MEPITRRNFLAASASVLLAACGRKVAAPTDDRIAILSEDVTREQMLAKGPLPEGARASLAAAVGAVLDRPVDAGHYVSCFEWRSANLPGYLHEYTQFTLAAGQVAARLYASTFESASVEQRRDVIRALTGEAHPEFTATKRQRRSVADYVVHEIHLIYARTDGWIALGYDGWPGLPRGLEAYTQAPAHKI